MSAPAQTPRPISLDEYEAIPESRRYKLELSRGQLVREPRPGAPHGNVTGNVYQLLHDHQLRGYGKAVIECGFELPLDLPTVRGPDVAFILKARLPDQLPPRWWPFAPDLAVEVVSPSNTTSEIRQKLLDYFEAGTQMVWVADPRTRTISVYRGLTDVRLLTERDELDGVPLLPELRVPVASLFNYEK